MGQLEGRRVAVTGAAGFVGGAVAARLAGKGADVVAVDIAFDEQTPVGIEAVRADVTDPAAVEPALEGCELVVHAAAIVGDFGSMEECERVNVGGTVTVLDAAQRTGARVVQISSVVVYGYDDPAEQDESAFRRTCGNPYIDTKSASDRIAQRRGAVVVRPGDIYGPRSIPWVVRPLRLAAATQRAAIPRGRRLMLPCYIDDLAGAVLAAAERGEPGTAYTVWDGAAVTFGEYFDRLFALVGLRAPARVPRVALEVAGAALERIAALRGVPPPLTSRAPVFLDRRGTASTERARSELGWKPTVSLDQGLERTAVWARAENLVD